MLPYKDSVVKCHTDGFLTKVKPQDIITGLKLGDLAYEGKYQQCIVKNNAKEVGELQLQ